MRDLDLRHLRYLIAVAETGSITRAARRLLITQPALSRAIQVLERTVGAPLLVRGSHATELTVAGAALLAEAYELVERSHVALERARSARPDAEALTVSVAVCDVATVTEAGKAFEAHHPGVRVRVVTHEWPSPPDEVEAGGADVFLLRDRPDLHGLDVDQLVQEPRRVLLPKDHPLARRERLSLSDLEDEPVTYWAGMSVKEADHWAGSDVDRRPRRHGPVVRSSTDVLGAVVLGRAIAFAHGSTLPDSELPGFCTRPVDGLSASRLDIGVPARGANPVVTTFAEYVRSRWATMNP